MTGLYATFVIVVSLVVAAWSAFHLLANRPISTYLRFSLLVITALFVIFAVGGIIQMAVSDRDFARLEFVGYLVLSPLIPLGAWWWVRGDTTRAGSAILLVVALVMPVLVIRIQQVWAGV
jgi:hypothetical protein